MWLSLTIFNSFKFLCNLSTLFVKANPDTYYKIPVDNFESHRE
jgi:hypothetical protein